MDCGLRSLHGRPRTNDCLAKVVKGTDPLTLRWNSQREPSGRRKFLGPSIASMDRQQEGHWHICRSHRTKRSINDQLPACKRAYKTRMRTWSMFLASIPASFMHDLQGCFVRSSRSWTSDSYLLRVRVTFRCLAPGHRRMEEVRKDVVTQIPSTLAALHSS